MKRIIILKLIVLLAIVANAQNPFERSILLKDVFPSSTSTSFVEMVDLDGDGDNDVVAAARSNSLVWYENLDGQGTFGNLNLISGNISNIHALDFGDINGDDLLDILIVSYNGDALTWFANQGNGVISTTPNSIIFNQDNISTATIVDLDSDGDNDVVFGFSTSFNFMKPLSWCENTDGLGSFSDRMSLTNFGQQTGHLGIGDFDGNGAMDVCVGGHNGVRVYYNDGNESFEIENLVITPSGGWHLISVLDYDGDGDLDIASGINSIEWNQNNGGSFSAAMMLYAESTSALQNGDFDGDGDLDLATVFLENSSLTWLENQGPNNPVVIHEFMEELIFPRMLHAGDIDSDGDTDLIGTPGIGHISKLINTDGLGTFERADDINAQLGWPSDMRSADIDGDGDLDALITDTGDDRLDWYENVNGDGSRMQQHNITYQFDGASTVVDLDVDGDGDLDVIALAGNDVRLLWFENTDGLGDFGAGNVIAEDLGSDHYLEASDMDGDGIEDIVLTLESGKKMMLFKNLGGSFDEGTEIFDQSHNFTATLLVDLDKDGDQDIVATNKSFPYIFWGENLLGTGEFSNLRILYTESDEMNNIHASDVDGDLDIDLIYTKDEEVKWMEHLDGIGDFAEAIEIDNLPFQSADIKFSEVKDLDNDGDEDIILVSNDGLFWYENLGYKSGRWGPRKFIDEEPFIYCHTADFSSDGVNDMLAFNLQEKTLYAYKNTLAPQNFITGYIHLEGIDSCFIPGNPVEGLLVSSSDGANVYASYTNKNGQFLNKVPLGNYTTTVSNLPTGFTIDPSAQMSSITATNRKDTLAYCIDANSMDPIQDNLSVHLFRLSLEARPGFDVFYQLVYRNMGTTTLSDSIVMTFENELMDYLSASETPDLVTDGTIRWTFDDLAPFESRKINIEFNIKPPPIVNLSEIFNFNTKIGPITDDIQPENNCYDYFHYVVGSYDPNDITVLEGPEVRYEDYLRTDTSNYLNYIIRFQNTGTASAINVRLANPIDQNLDWTSLEILSSSHTYRAAIENQDTLNIYYDGIYLPDSTTDLAGSQGYIIYQIKMKEGLDVGTTFLNDAAIYFDFNEPIYTNQVATELIETTTSLHSLVPSSKASIYPNPTSQWANIKHEEKIEFYQIHNIQGALIHTKLNSNKIDMRPFQKGVYLLKFRNALGELYTLKLIKL